MPVSSPTQREGAVNVGEHRCAVLAHVLECSLLREIRVIGVQTHLAQVRHRYDRYHRHSGALFGILGDDNQLARSSNGAVSASVELTWPR